MVNNYRQSLSITWDYMRDIAMATSSSMVFVVSKLSFYRLHQQLDQLIQTSLRQKLYTAVLESSSECICYLGQGGKIIYQWSAAIPFSSLG